MPSFFSRFNSSKSGKDRPTGTLKTKPTTSQGSRSDDTPANLLPLELPSSSLLADTSRANPHFLSTPVRQLSFHSAHKLADDDRGEQSDLRSLRSSEGGGSPWVAVDAENTPRTIRKGSFVAGGGGSAKVGFPELADPERERREQARLERARLTVEDVTLLSEECGDVIRSRGLTSLGLFRPYRASESPAQIRKLALLFLDYVAEFDERAAATTHEASPSRGTDASKSVLLHAYRQELRFANVHDVVAVLKWGLRHIDFGRLTFSSARVPSLEWYSSFVRRSSSASPPHPPHAFSQFLLPSLPPPSQKLLLSLLHTIQPVAAHAQQNAMPAHRLCYLLGAYAFGLATPPPPSSISSSAGANRVEWEDYSRLWSEAGRALEGCLKAYLREQTDLPPRLQELIEDYSTWVSDENDAPSRHVRTIKALKLEVESVGEWESAGAVRSNSQSTGLGTDGNTGRPARRRPGEILAAAMGSDLPAGQHDDNDDAEVRAWNALSRLLQAADYSQEPNLAPFDEETVRVLKLLNLARSTADPARETGTTPSRHNANSPHRRTRSSVDPADLPSPTRPLTAFLSPSPSMPTISPGGKLRSSPSWHDFSTQGFTQSSLDLSSDLYDPSKNRVAPAPRMYKPAPPTSRITSISTIDVEEDFVAVWLDSLSESATTSSPAASWPSILLSPLSPAAQSEVGDSSSRIAALLIVEALLTRQRATETLDSPPRIASLQPPTTHVTVDRRASFLGVRRGRKSEGAPPSSSSTSPPSSPSKNWRRRASALFAPPMPSRNQSSDQDPSMTSTAHGTVSLDSSPRARTAVPSLHARRPSAGRVPSDAPVDVFGTAIPLPPPPPPVPPKEWTSSEKIATPPAVKEAEGYVVDEPGLATLHEPAHEPAFEATDTTRADLETEEAPQTDSGVEQSLGTAIDSHSRDAEADGHAELNDESEEAPEGDHLAPALDGDTSTAATAEPEPDVRMERDHADDTHVSPDRHVLVSDVAEPESLPALPADDLVTRDGLVPNERSDDAMLDAAEQGKAESVNQSLSQEAHGAHGNGDASVTEDAKTHSSEPKLLAPAIPLALSEELAAEPAVTTDDSVQLRDSAPPEAVYNDESSPAAAEVPSVEPVNAASSEPVTRGEPPSTPSPRRRVPTPIATPRRSLDSNRSPSPLASPPPRSPRHPARGLSSPIRGSSTPGSRSALHKASSSSVETETEEIKQLRKVEEEAKRKIVKEQKTPKLVSNVKERVREIEEEVIRSPTTAAGPASDPTSPIRPSSPKQQPFTPNRSSFLQASPSSSARGPPPILAPPIVAGSPTSLAPAALPMSLLASADEHTTDGDANVAESVVADAIKPVVLDGVTSSPDVHNNPSGEATSAIPEPETAADHEHTASNIVDAGPERIIANAAVAASPPEVAPTQESEHLHVKVPTSLAELPSPMPSPSPFVADGEGEAVPLVEDVPVIQDGLRTITSNPEPERKSEPETPADYQHVAASPADRETEVMTSDAADAASPTPESEHLQVKVPVSLADLPSPIPSPSPSPFVDGGEGEAAPLVEEVPVFQNGVQTTSSKTEPEPETPADHEHTASDLVDADSEPIDPDAVVTASPPRLPPTQESEHLQVKVPTSLAELPSPIPSPSPFAAEGEGEGEAAPLVEDVPVVQDDLQTITSNSEPLQVSGRSIELDQDAAQPERLPEEIVAGVVTPEEPLLALRSDEPIERPATPPPHLSTQNETTHSTRPDATRPPIHVLRVSPSKQSLATTAASSYQTAAEGPQTTSVADSGSGSGSDHEQPAL